jgi:hypothetical protein
MSTNAPQVVLIRAVLDGGYVCQERVATSMPFVIVAYTVEVIQERLMQLVQDRSLANQIRWAVEPVWEEE